MKIEDIKKFEPLTRPNNKNELVDVRIELKDGTVVTDSKESRKPGERNEVQMFLSSLPRTTAALTCPKIKVLDKTWTLGHAYQTDEERSKTSARGTGSGTVSDGTVRIKKDEWNKLLEILDKSQDPDLKAWVEVNKPEDPAMKKAKDALSGLSPEQLKVLMASLQA